MTVAIIDYQSGNLRSAQKAFERAAREAGLDADIKVTADPDVVVKADRIVLPGVGAFADCRRGVEPMVEALEDAVIAQGKPFFGICVGMQLIASRGLEHETVAGFDWIAGEVRAMQPVDSSLKIPHMGWNQLSIEQPCHPVLRGIGGDDYVYFVHSFALFPEDEAVVQASVEYGGMFAAAVAKDNMFGTQFHPEKSQQVGLRLITNFLRWQP